MPKRRQKRITPKKRRPSKGGRRTALKRGCSNRDVRSAINTLSGYVHAVPGRRRRGQSPANVKRAINTLTSCNIQAGAGRRGGITRGNHASALEYIARYEIMTGKRLRKLGGFKRSIVDKAKRILRRTSRPRRMTAKEYDRNVRVVERELRVTKPMWYFEWSGGGYNSVKAETVEEAKREAVKLGRSFGLHPLLNTLTQRDIGVFYV